MKGGYPRGSVNKTRYPTANVNENGITGNLVTGVKLEVVDGVFSGDIAVPRNGGGEVSSGDAPHMNLHVLPTADSPTFWQTGVASVSCRRLEEGNTPPGDGKQTLDRTSTTSTGGFLQVSSSREDGVCSGRVTDAQPSGNLRSANSLSSSSSGEHATVCVLEDATPCNVVPLLPRHHPEYGLVSQIVPLTVWPPPNSKALAASFDGCDAKKKLQRVVSLTSWLHGDHLQSDSSLLQPPTEAAEGVIVEWVSGDIGYTADVKGLWAEQRIFGERYYNIPPVDPLGPQCTGCDSDCTNNSDADGEVRYTEPHLPPTTLRGTVLEQLRRFRVSPRYVSSLSSSCIDDREWVFLFARVVQTRGDCSGLICKLLKVWDTAPSRETAVMCDILLDEIIQIGIAPRNEPQRLILLCPSLAYRILVNQDMRASGGQVSKQAAAEIEYVTARRLLEEILQATAVMLRYRIAVQYELMRLLRCMPLTGVRCEIAAKYGYWYRTVPAPSTVLRALVGCKVFGRTFSRLCLIQGRVVERSPAKRPREDSGCNGGEQQKTRNGAVEGASGRHGGVERELKQLPNNKISGRCETVIDVSSSEDENDHEADDDGSNGCDGEEEEGEGSDDTGTTGRDDIYENRGIIRSPEVLHANPGDLPMKRLVPVFYEMDLLPGDFVARFAAALRGQQYAGDGTGSDAHSSSEDCGSASKGSTSAGHMGYDEVSLAHLTSWLRRMRCTMTLTDLTAYVVKNLR